jgi:drug/metabolite transporter (DMT)-like permease
MATAWWAIVIVSLSTFIGAIGQYNFKKGADILVFNVKKIITNKYILTGLGAYAVGSIIWVLVLPYGELSTLYPFIGLNYIWVAWVSKRLLKEHMNAWKWLGIACLVLGVALVGLGA